MTGSGNMIKLLLVLTFVGINGSLYTAFYYAPTEKVMGHIQRIFTSIWVRSGWRRSPSCWYLSPASSICDERAGLGISWPIPLRDRGNFLNPYDDYWEYLGQAGLEYMVDLGSQVTTTFLLWVFYIAYLIIRSAAGTDLKAARFSAVLGLLPLWFCLLSMSPLGLCVEFLRSFLAGGVGEFLPR